MNLCLIKTGIRDNVFGKDTFSSNMMETLSGCLTPTTGAGSIAPHRVERERH